MAPFGDVCLAIDIIPEKGGQCSFYCRFPLKSRFLKDLDTKKQVVFDTTSFFMEENQMKEIYKSKLPLRIMFGDPQYFEEFKGNKMVIGATTKNCSARLTVKRF